MFGNKPLRIALQIAALLALAVFVGTVVFSKGVRPERQRDLWNGRDGFVAISYGGIGHSLDRRDIVTKERLKAQLEALSAAGYVTVTTADVVAFLDHGRPLPEKALYLMFEGGRKDSVLFAQPILAGLGAVATVFVPTDRLSGWNRFFLHPGELKDVSKSPYWDVGTMGQDALTLLPRPDGTQAYYLAALKTNPDGTAESLDEFRARMRADDEAAIKAVSDATGKAPEVYIFTPANTLDQSMAPELRDVVQQEIARSFAAAFTREGECFNSRDADAHDLTRLQVDPSWSAGRLLEEIDSRLPKTSPDSFPRLDEPRLWNTVIGGMQAGDGAVELTSASTGQAFVRLRGTETMENAAFAATVTPSAECAELVYLRYKNVDSYLRLLVSPNQVQIQEKSGGKLNYLLQIPLLLDPGQSVGLAGRVTGNRLVLAVGGKPVSAYPIPLSASTDRGVFALGLLAREAGAKGSFTKLVVRPEPPLWKDVHDVGRLDLDAPESLSAVILPADHLLPGKGPEYDAMLAAAARGMATYARLARDATPERLAAFLGGFDTPFAPAVAHLLRGFVLPYAKDADPAAVEALIKAVRSRGYTAVLEVPSESLPHFAAEKAVLSPDWIMIGRPEDKGGAELAGIENRYDKTRMLFLAPDNPDAACSVYVSARR
ncbi:hypothetical protein dsx2_2531 [Desulfovibrio sp. X2]|uniref:hypothetical protein n=1 Tax=Desulfovibrio sp. X2 TaxID=941449 RepID=UPI0003588E00|nr:hypothetical protein [Desulfovibrio sp. X2]EPR43171.1 hypothetical protein dsx2_2531 [Desulfovibrio sp. X2]